MATTKNIEELLEFFSHPSSRCYFNNELLAVKNSPISTGLGVFAKKTKSPVGNVDDNDLMLRVHKSMVLAAQTCTIANFLYEEHLGGMEGLVIAFIYEKQLGEKSPWFHYINSINYHDEKNNLILPLCLQNENDLKILKGSELEFMDGLNKDDLMDNFKISCDFAKTVKQKIKWEIPEELNDSVDLSFNKFAAITMAIASRAFEVDNYIELGLVPGADLFNHSYNGEENVHFVTLGDVCPICGKAECSHDEFGPPDSEEEEDNEWEDIDSGIEITGDGSESEEDNDDEITDEETQDLDSEEDMEEITMDFVDKLELESKEEAEDSEDDDEDEEDLESEDEEAAYNFREFFCNTDECCDVILENKITKGKEVFNTYGELPNAILLVKYGFAIENNTCDTVCLGMEISKYRKEHPELEERFDWWSCMGWHLLRELERLDEKELHSSEDCESDCEETAADDDSEFSDDEGPDEEEEENSWLLQCRVEYPGRPSNHLLAVSRLVNLTDEQFEELASNEDVDGDLILEKLCYREKGKKAKAKLGNPILYSWAQERLKKYSFRNAREVSQLAKNSNNNPRRKAYAICVAAEMSLLENI